ncbi:MAG: hypothetical protein DCC65_08585 [Planctomycetota bacterium]|nr:MAG: hypothetical protein DCC65_08585 [Planctomycetota bacterium]
MTRLPLILAENPIVERLKGLRGGFNTRDTVTADMAGFLWFMVGAATVLLIVFVWSRRRQQKSLHAVSAHPRRIFAAGLKYLGIRLTDRLVLEFIARRCGIDHPAAMLLCPDLLEEGAGRWADAIRIRTLGRFFRVRVERLRRAAFGEPSTVA